MKKTALIYNQCLQTAGGGERLCFEIASSLEQAGYEITFIMVGSLCLNPTELAASFGIPCRSQWKFVNIIRESDIPYHCRNEGYEVFVNNTYGSFVLNLAPIGIYVCMFPQALGEGHRKALESYTFIQSISDFTDTHVKDRWKVENSKVIVPPITQAHFNQTPCVFGDKEKLVLCIGRFNVEGHNKCQLDAIEAFTKFQLDKIIDESWQLIVVGRLNAGLNNALYLKRCISTANVNVSILEGLSLEELIRLYRRAALLWQFTGFGIPFGERPEECEHLGLVAMDCFPYGAIPMLYQRSGMASLIEHGVTGYAFGDREELATIMGTFAENFGGSFHKFQFEKALDASRKFSPETFAAHLNEEIAAATSVQQ